MIVKIFQSACVNSHSLNDHICLPVPGSSLPGDDGMTHVGPTPNFLEDILQVEYFFRAILIFRHTEKGSRSNIVAMSPLLTFENRKSSQLRGN